MTVYRGIPPALTFLDALKQLSADSSVIRGDGPRTYTIPGFDGSPYLTRTLFPRIGDLRPLLHHIHRDDSDEWMHNHPWKTARFLILSGGYVEERRIEPVIPHTCAGLQVRHLKPGDVNEITHDTFHRVVDVQPDTWTLGLVGERMQDWGFLARPPGEELIRYVPHADYFAMRGHVLQKSDSTS